MYAVSQSYKTESRQIIRNPSYMRITYSVIEPDADDLATPVDNGHMYYSDIEDAVLNTPKSVTPTATLEHNRWYLDGSQTIIPDDEPYGYVGYIGDALSGSDCVYTTPPIISIAFGDYFAFAGLTIDFDTVVNDYPSEIRIDGYNNGDNIYTKIFYPDKSEWVCTDRIPSEPGTYVNRLDITYVESNKPYRRARLEQLIFGVLYKFENRSLASASWNRKISPIAAELPTENFAWDVIDIEKHFDPENAEGIYAYLESRQDVSIDIGYQLNDGSIEWMPLGKMYSTSSFSTDGSLNIASFEANSTLLSLTQTYSEGVYNPSGTTLYDAAKAMLDYSWQVAPKYVLSERLKNYRTKAPMPVDLVRNNLQLIANAGMCQLYTDRDGVIHIEEASTELQDFRLTFDDVLESPKIDKIPVLYSVTTKYRDITVSSEVTELLNTEVSYDTDTVVELSYDESTAQTLTPGSGVTITGPVEYYASMCRCTMRGTGSVVVTGKTLEDNENIVAQIYNNKGEDCPIENPLITSRAWALAYCDWIAAYEKRRNQYSVPDRGYPEIDMGDVISVDTSFTEALTVTVVSHNINFSGAISGTSEYLIGGDE